jgi:hypothetical protein
MFNKFVRIEEGLNYDDMDKFERVYSGHIHYAQRNKNVVMVGNAYQMTRSDGDNPKGVFLLDFETGEHQFIENDYTPKFVKLNLTKILDKTIDEIKDSMRNNFVDLYIASDIPIKYNLSGFMSMVQAEARKIEPNIYDEKTYIDIDSISEEIQNGYKNFNVINLCDKFIESMNIDDDDKKRLGLTINKLYTDCTNKYKAE